MKRQSLARHLFLKQMPRLALNVTAAVPNVAVCYCGVLVSVLTLPLTILPTSWDLITRFTGHADWSLFSCEIRICPRLFHSEGRTCEKDYALILPAS